MIHMVCGFPDIKIHIFAPSNCICYTWQNTGNKTMYIKADNKGNIQATVCPLLTWTYLF